MQFLEIYKQVDLFCKNGFRVQNGISTYIEALEGLEGQDRYGIDWEPTYKMLKHCRNIRNRIAHEVGVDEKDICTERDREWIEYFYSLLLTRRDPLTLYKQARAESSSGKIDVDPSLIPNPYRQQREEDGIGDLDEVTSYLDKAKEYLKNKF